MAEVAWWTSPALGLRPCCLSFLNGLSVNLHLWTAVPCCHPSPGLTLPLHGLLSL